MTDDGMALLKTLSLQKAELLEAYSVLHLRHLPGLKLRHKLIHEEGDLLCKIFGILISRGKHCGIFHLRSGYPLQCLSSPERPGPPHP
jgi:hypothetical protein